MGEYFAPVICREDWKEPGYYSSHAFGTWLDFEGEGGAVRHTLMGIGSKICEHYYVGNRMVDAVCSWLRRGTYRVAWLGDYTDTDTVPSFVPRDLFRCIWKEVWGGSEDDDKDVPDVYWIREHPVPIPAEPCEYKWLLDLDKCQAVRLPGINPHLWDVSPLPILTTTDGVPCYSAKHTVPDRVIGSWAWDRLTIVDEFPEGDWDVLRYDFGTEE